MPREWHDRHAVNQIEDIEKRQFYRAVVADKKPYFMRYIYPALMKQYNTYIKNTDRNAIREFQMTVSELRALPYNELTERQKEFLRYFDYRMPVGLNVCVMNRICKRFEEEFDGCIGRYNSLTDYDYKFMKSDAEYSEKQYSSIKKLYEDYGKRLSNYMVFTDYERVDECESLNTLTMMNNEFRKECDIICPNKDVLCNILLDICYTRNCTKRFVWNMCSSEIIHNLLKTNKNKIKYPTLCENGDIEYCGYKFSIEIKEFEVDE